MQKCAEIPKGFLLGERGGLLDLTESVLTSHWRSNIALRPIGHCHIRVKRQLAGFRDQAAASLLSGNLADCLAALCELHNETHPSVERLRQAVAAWRKSQSLWRRFAMAVGVYTQGGQVNLYQPCGISRLLRKEIRT